jgi:hypothetical protein
MDSSYKDQAINTEYMECFLTGTKIVLYTSFISAYIDTSDFLHACVPTGLVLLFLLTKTEQSILDSILLNSLT